MYIYESTIRLSQVQRVEELEKIDRPSQEKEGDWMQSHNLYHTSQISPDAPMPDTNAFRSRGK